MNLAYIILFVVVIIAGPLITIFSLNTLFPALAIPYNAGTWFAALWISATVYGATK